jgi:hypothetical protein
MPVSVISQINCTSYNYCNENDYIKKLAEQLNILSEKLKKLDEIKQHSLKTGISCQLRPEQHEEATGLAVEAKNTFDAIVIPNGNSNNNPIMHFKKTFKELEIKFSLKGIVENPVDWLDYALSHEIYDNLLKEYTSGNLILNDEYLTEQNITLSDINKFKEIFQYNFASNLFSGDIKASNDSENKAYRLIMDYLDVKGIESKICHKITKLVIALIIAQDCFDRVKTPNWQEDSLIKDINNTLYLEYAMLLIHAGLPGPQIIQDAIDLVMSNKQNFCL